MAKMKAVPEVRMIEGLEHNGNGSYVLYWLHQVCLPITSISVNLKVEFDK